MVIHIILWQWQSIRFQWCRGKYTNDRYGSFKLPGNGGNDTITGGDGDDYIIGRTRSVIISGRDDKNYIFGNKDGYFKGVDSVYIRDINDTIERNRDD